MENGFDFMDDIEDQDEEVQGLTAEQISRTVLQSTDWTTETIISQLVQGNIDLNPRFQRRDAWNLSRKSKFIESLILGLPVPQIVLAERKGKRGTYIVLDGKQRLLSLLQFVGKASEGKNNAYRLTGLEVLDDLNKKSYEDFQENLYRNERVAFHNSTIRSVVVRSWPNIEFLHLVFHRLNTGSVSLSPQELRQALFPGKFIDYVYDRADNSELIRKLLGISEPDFRMRDVELFIRHVGLQFFLQDYAGNLRSFLDNTCEKLNKAWNEEEDRIVSSIDGYEGALDTMIQIFGEENIARKWTGEAYEKRPNRAVLDIMAYYFSDRKVREVAIRKSKNVVKAFQDICVQDDQFRKSIESTTKSLGSMYIRLSTWGRVLNGVLDLQMPLPSYNNERNRIETPGR